MKSTDQTFTDRIKAASDLFASTVVAVVEEAIRSRVAASLDAQRIALGGPLAQRLLGGRMVSPAHAAKPTGGAAMASGEPTMRPVRGGENGAKTQYGKKPTTPSGGSTLTTLLATIKKTPGLRSEELPGIVSNGKDIKGTTLKALVASGHLRCTGRARGTKYYVTKKQYKAA